MVDFDALLEIADLDWIKDLVKHVIQFLLGHARVQSRGEGRIKAHIDSAEMIRLASCGIHFQ